MKTRDYYSRMGEKGKRKSKKAPLTGAKLDALIAKNLLIEKLENNK